MIQRFIFLALRDGINQITADPTLLEQLFADLFELEPAEVEGVKKVFAAKPPTVIHGYAPRDAVLPCYSITLQGEAESEMFLNNDEPQVLDPDSPDFGADVKGSIWDHTFHILTYTEHPDVTTYYYEIAKSIMLASTDFFAERDLFDIHLSGADLAPDPRYMPEHAFARRLAFKCDRLFSRVDRTSLAGKAFKVGGLHIDKSGSPSSVGGVKTLIDPTTPLAPLPKS